MKLSDYWALCALTCLIYAGVATWYHNAPVILMAWVAAIANMKTMQMYDKIEKDGTK